MRIISLWQPFAMLVVLGLKQYETRHWDTSYRGLLGIHAARHWTKQDEAMLRSFIDEFKLDASFGSPLRDTLSGSGKYFGSLIGTVRVVNTYPTESLTHISYREFCFGDYSAKRRGWLLNSATLFKEPIPMIGHQGFWEADVEI